MSKDLLNHVFETSSLSGNARVVMLALAWRADDDGVSWMGMAAIARMANVTERSVQRIVPTLVTAGELEVRPGEGPRGTNLYRIVAAAGRQLVLMSNGAASVGGDKLSGPTTASPNTPSSLSFEISGDGDVLGDKNVEPTRSADLSPAREIREIQTRASAVWLAHRRGPGLQRFTDGKALKWLKSAVARALSAGAQWSDVDSGIRGRAKDANANPSYADEWIEAVATQRRESEHLARKMAERDRENRRSSGLRQINLTPQELVG